MSWSLVARDTIGAGDDVIVLADDPAPIALAAAEAAGARGSVRVAACTAEAERHLSAVLAGKATVFRAAPGDLSTDVVRAEAQLAATPPRSLAEARDVIEEARAHAQANPIIPAESADTVIAIGVLGRVPPAERRHAIEELYRVLRRGGTCVLYDAVSDEPLPARLAADPAMPAVMQELELLSAMEDAKFHGLTIEHWPDEPDAVFEGIECRRIAIMAHKGKEGICRDGLQAVVYLGPFKVVEDDDGHVIRRGQRFAVCKKTFGVYQRPPYLGMFANLEPPEEVPDEQAPLWDPAHPSTRSPSETKGLTRSAAAVPPPAAGATGEAYAARAVWLTPDGRVRRQARVTHRYRGYFESYEEAESTARTVFEDASRYEVYRISMQEALEHMAKTGRQAACPVTKGPGGGRDGARR
ncbi:MAG TPA: methyltransferase domain-containing protein [Armatimonadota bacterium]|nr:methyltransferase domain-containing protein [Armatimonadota bacterium]